MINQIDRIAPTHRPGGRNDGTQSWRSLLFCHWQVPLRAVQACLPAGLEVDTFDGQAFVGVVPFKMRAVRPRWLPTRLGFNFLETNVRTYVTYNGRPGVYFFSLDANSRLAVWAARTGWSLPYRFAQMSAAENGQRYSYQSRRQSGGEGHRVTFRIDQERGESAPETLEHFLLERYLMFVGQRKKLFVGQVYHRPYHAFTAIIDDMHDDLVAASGLPSTNQLPELAHYCHGVDVEVFGIRRLPLV